MALLAWDFQALLVVILMCVICWTGAQDTASFFGEEGFEDDFAAWNILRPHRRYNRVNVLDYGAKADGLSDDSQAFLDAWSAACDTNYSILIVPNNTYVLQPTSFSGPCGIGMKVQLDGTLVAPSFDNWTIGLMRYEEQYDDPDDGLYSSQNQWLSFHRLDNLIMQGDGGFDGQGESWWSQSCKINHSNPCHSAPAAVTFSRSQNLVLRRLSFLNSPQMHLIIDSCSRVRLFNLLVTAPGKSPNTDGIHLHASNDVVIQDCVIGTGDDCVSIQTGSFNIRIKNGTYGPGHGISIGSLGKNNGTANVTAVVVDGTVLNGTTNGLRIKTWQGGHGVVQGVRYQNVKMIDVSYPIIVDQYYCDLPGHNCRNQTSAVEVSEIVYQNVSGTSATPVAVKFACSDTVPCHNIILKDVTLTSVKSNVTRSFCENANGAVFGTISPEMCF